jgi:transcriptional regulator with XRE-family HTH domain
MSQSRKRIKNAEILAELGSLLRAERERLRLTQAQVSHRARGLRQATISKIERGGDATLDSLVSYAAALGLEWVLAPVGRAPYNTPSFSNTTPNAKPLSLLEEFADLRDDDQ